MKHIRETLSNAGFYVSDLYSIQLPGFDIVARRDNTLLIIKVLMNIDAFSETTANELYLLARLLQGTPLLIGEKNGLGPLEDDVVYDRFGVHATTLNTLRDHLLEGMPIKTYAGPGGLYVNIDEKKLQTLRQEQGISLGEFARHVRVSRKTAQLYEQGMNARAEIAERVEDLLKEVISIPIELLKPSEPKRKTQPSFTSYKDRLQEFEREIFSLLEHIGYKITPMEKCPFEAVSKERKQVILTCVQKYDKKLQEKAHIVSRISKITETHAVAFTDKETGKKNLEGTPLIIKKELKKIRDPEEIIELIFDRI